MSSKELKDIFQKQRLKMVHATKVEGDAYILYRTWTRKKHKWMTKKLMRTEGKFETEFHALESSTVELQEARLADRDNKHTCTMVRILMRNNLEVSAKLEADARVNPSNKFLAYAIETNKRKGREIAETLERISRSHAERYPLEYKTKAENHRALKSTMAECVEPHSRKYNKKEVVGAALCKEREELEDAMHVSMDAYEKATEAWHLHAVLSDASESVQSRKWSTRTLAQIMFCAARRKCMCNCIVCICYI